MLQYFIVKVANKSNLCYVLAIGHCFFHDCDHTPDKPLRKEGFPLAYVFPGDRNCHCREGAVTSAGGCWSQCVPSPKAEHKDEMSPTHKTSSFPTPHTPNSCQEPTSASKSPPPEGSTLVPDSAIHWEPSVRTHEPTGQIIRDRGGICVSAVHIIIWETCKHGAWVIQGLLRSGCKECRSLVLEPRPPLGAFSGLKLRLFWLAYQHASPG